MLPAMIRSVEILGGVGLVFAVFIALAYWKLRVWEDPRIDVVTSMLPGPSGASARQDSQTPHGSGVGPCSQFSERARIRADDVFPQPRGPLNR